jgi:catechol 2,3-dioxygenase-like lactoylglutathione lyase family enzyme
MIIDHIEIFVPDRSAAADWYRKVLGFQVVERLLDWAESGPLMISNDGGSQMIALFEGEPQATRPICGIRRLAFRTSGDDFAAFIRSSSTWSDPPLGLDDIEDHSRSVSVYFTDPFGNPLEVTTYDYEVGRRFLDSMRHDSARGRRTGL